MASEQGYSNQKKKGRPQFKTIHSVNSDAYAESVIPKYLYETSLPCNVISTTDVIGSNGQVEFWEIYVTGLGMQKGGILRMEAGSALSNFEFQILELIDIDKALVLPIGDIKPTAGMVVKILNWVTALSDQDGNPQISLSPAPVKFVLDGSTVDVSKDSATPANSVLLPTENLIAQASLSSIDGKFTTLNAKDFATSAKQDTGNSSLSSIDGKFTTLNAKDFATSAKQDTGNSSLSSIDGKFTTLNAKDFATAAKQDTGNVSLNSIDGKFTTLNAVDFATSVKQDTGNTSLSSIDGKLQGNGFLDAGNSSTTPLGIGGVFTGVAFEVTKYAAINVNVKSDVASAAGGVKVEFSPDGTNWDHSHQTTYGAATGVGYVFNAEYRFARIVYTNGASAQTVFRLQTIFKTTLVTSSLYTLSQSVNSNMFAVLGRNIIAGETTGGGGGYVNVKVNPSGALTVEADVTGTVSVSNFPATQNVAEQTQSGTITQTQKSVGLTAVRATVSGSAPGAARKKLMIKPSKNNTGSVYLGSSSVTTSNGLEIIGPDRLEFELDSSDYYLISDTAAQVVEIIEVV
jgi:hypothetical protein